MKSELLTKETILTYGMTDRGFPSFKAGDTVSVVQIIREGAKERLQSFDGDVIMVRKNGIATTFTVRKIGAGGIGVERIFPYYSPNIKSIQLLREGKVRRACLRYLRDRVGKHARIKQKEIRRKEG